MRFLLLETVIKIIDKESGSMRWEEVRKLYPNQYVLLEIQSHIKGDKQYIDDVFLIRSISLIRKKNRSVTSY